VPRIDSPVGRALRHLMAQSLHSELYVRRPQRVVALACVELNCPIGVRTGRRAPRTNVPAIKLLRLPRLKTLGDLFRKAVRIAGRAKCLFCQKARRLVISMPVSVSTRKSRDQDVRTEGSDHSHHVCQGYVMSTPFRERLVGRL